MTMRKTMDQVSWTHLRDYLVSRGFRLLPTGRTDVGVYRNGDVEVRVPFDPTFDDYLEALERAARTIARFENRALDEVVADLSMPRSDKEDVHVGRVVELRADANDAGKLEGEVILRLDADDELIRARCSLGPDDYRKALDAHGRQRYVSVRGRLIRAGRTYMLEDPNELKVIA